MNVSGRWALVTGGAHRVGGVISSALAEAGCNVIVHYHQAANQAEERANHARTLGSQAITIQADLRNHENILDLFSQVDREGIELDFLVTSAAVMHAYSLIDATEADWQHTIDLNLKAVFFCLQQAARRMQGRGGAIVNISDIMGLRPWKRFPIHSISKAGIEMLTRVAALALAPEIRVNAVAPGPVIKPDTTTEARWEKLTSRLPLQHGGSGMDVARAVIFLFENEFITGETLVVDGGGSLE
jgi:pteridine reductase